MTTATQVSESAHGDALDQLECFADADARDRCSVRTARRRLSRFIAKTLEEQHLKSILGTPPTIIAE